MKKSFIKLSLFGIFALPSFAAFAQDADSESKFKLSGFLSVVGGKTISGKLDPNYSGPTNIKGTDCPCYVADWSNAGVYGNQLTLRPESRVGIQGKYTINPEASITTQLTSRGTHATPEIAWAFASYKLNENFELQVGRKRIPLYYYSDFQDIGVSYPWVSPPPELYGWEATNYNGASIRYSKNIDDINITASVFGGQEKVKSSFYQKLYYPIDRTEVRWNNMMGADVEVNNGPLTVRAVAMTTKVRTNNYNGANFVNDNTNLKAYGLAVNLDFDKWFVLSEVTQLTRDHKASIYSDPFKVTAPVYTIGAGMRFGKWTPFINYAKFDEKTLDVNLYKPGVYDRTSATLRYDLDSSSTVKTQIDRNTDITNNFGGHSTMFRISYDRVF
ncbi:MAG: hypothetical protein K2Q11_02830 [Burkholderiaceae bacterium]|nr:hypothetical protein [Burkholderiaceae bacterium]